LLGVISLNHDHIFQVASKKVYSGVNLGFNFKSNHFKFVNTDCPLLIHLHGAFNFRKDKPIKVLRLTSKTKYHQNMLWIPPTILKESKDYPFNKMMGLSYELISKCDVLRIIGCSLSQNDWNLISLIFSAQNNQYFFKSDCFKIELIMTTS
ncbi:MAG TPA: hypothetical protein VI728_02965, partial [Syntrophales bacterium]|nr:hypothetical protein [Syntrophales bacterium]